MQSRFPIWLQKTAIVISIILSVVFFNADVRQKTSNGIETFYYASQAAKNGQDIYASHAPKSDSHGELKAQYVYPPLFAVIMTPILHFKLMTATRLWLCFNVIMTWVILIVGAREIGRRFQLPRNALFIAALASSAFILSAGEIKTEWATGQTDTLILISFLLGLVWLERSPILAGIALGAGANIKYQPLFAVPYLVARRQWKAAVTALAGAVAVGMLPALMLGWQGNIDSLKSAFGGLGGFAGIQAANAANTTDITWIRSVSITSAAARLLDNMGLKPHKAFDIAGLVALGVLALVWWIYKKQGCKLFAADPYAKGGEKSRLAITSLEWVGLMVAWLAFGPEVSRRHMFVLLLLDLVIVAVLVVPTINIRKTPLIVGLIIFQIGLRLPPSNFDTLTTFWNGVGGPSWCLLLVYFTLLWTGLSVAKGLSREEPPQTGLQPDPVEPELVGV